MTRSLLFRNLVLLLVCLVSPVALAAGKTKPRTAPPPASKRKTKPVAQQTPSLKAPKKLTRLPGGESLRNDAARAFQKMIASARESGLFLWASSGYRNLKQQRQLYRRFVRGLGPPAARPGRSNHHLGIAVDIPVGGDETTNSYAWLAANACRYGFQRTVPVEPWHWEYRPESTSAPADDADCTGRSLAPAVMTEELQWEEAPPPPVPQLEDLQDLPAVDPMANSISATYRA